jgi:hypothetical protein
VNNKFTWKQKEALPNLRFCHIICLVGLRQTMQYFRRTTNLLPSFNLRSSKCVTGGHTAQPSCFVIFILQWYWLCFRSMDGVREHARNHEQQEQVSEIFYITAEAGQEGPNSQCEEDCPYQSKEKHYHCTWVSFLTHHWIKLSRHESSCAVGKVRSSVFLASMGLVRFQAFHGVCVFKKKNCTLSDSNHFTFFAEVFCYHCTRNLYSSHCLQSSLTFLP